MRSRVQDVMTTEVIAVDQTTCFKELVNLLAAYRLSALPVVDADRRVVGIVSEADLLLKEEFPAAEPTTPTERASHRAERAKAAGRVAADFMTTPVISVGPGASLTETARLAKTHAVKRLPVIDEDGYLIGIVTRSDLLKVFLRSDQEIHAEIVRDVIVGSLLLDPARFAVEVRDGVVTLQGMIQRRRLIPLLVQLVYGVDGVVHVEDRLGWETDDSDLDLPAILARYRA